jgi:hypothetical protein
MKKKIRFKIGDWVKVRARTYFYYDKNDERQIEVVLIKEPRYGQIVGARRKFLGKFEKPSGVRYGFMGEYIEGDQSYLTVKSSVLVWLVREGYLNKELEVLEEHVGHMLNPPIEKDIFKFEVPKKSIPWIKQDKYNLNEKERNDLKEAMKHVPRDAKGRWIK